MIAQEAEVSAGYSKLGIVKMSPMDFNPKGNEDLLYNPANRPTNPGTFLPGQAISDLTFVSGYSQRRIRITMNPGDNPVQAAGSIAIINENGDIIWSVSDEVQTAIEFIQAQSDIVSLKIIPQVETTADTVDIQVVFPGSSADALNIGNAGTGDGIDLETVTGRGINIVTSGGWAIAARDLDPVGGVFQRIMLFNNGAGPVLIISDGTDPNGLLTSPIGSVCLNSTVTGQISYNTDGGTTWVAL